MGSFGSGWITSTSALTMHAAPSHGATLQPLTAKPPARHTVRERDLTSSWLGGWSCATRPGGSGIGVTERWGSGVCGSFDPP